MGLSGPGNSGKFLLDGDTLRFIYQDTSGAPHIVSCTQLANSGTGTWS